MQHQYTHLSSLLKHIKPPSHSFNYKKRCSSPTIYFDSLTNQHMKITLRERTISVKNRKIDQKLLSKYENVLIYHMNDKNYLLIFVF